MSLNDTKQISHGREMNVLQQRNVFYFLTLTCSTGKLDSSLESKGVSFGNSGTTRTDMYSSRVYTVAAF